MPGKRNRFTITVQDVHGKQSSFTVTAVDIEDAARRACRMVVLRPRGVTALRTSGEPGGPGWFAPFREKAKFPWAGNGFRVAPEATKETPPQPA